ncbi:hypothetical protein C8R44DRAFT_740628 [Mycena epipterygia]|nr:hypothetical protein C8R44DRAFT_740628 [Mycena epipterygia]
MSAKVVILAQFDHGYYIRGTLKWLADIFARLEAWWIRTRNICPHCLAREEMSAKVVILAQFDHKYYIRETLKWLTGGLAWPRDWWICVSVKQVTDSKSMPLLPRREEMPAKVVILAQFDHGYYIRETLKRLTDVVGWLKAWWIRFDHRYYIHGTLKRLTDVVAWLQAWWICTRNPCPRCIAGEEMPAKVVILAQFGHGYHICGTLKWLTVVLAWLRASWIQSLEYLV